MHLSRDESTPIRAYIQIYFNYKLLKELVKDPIVPKGLLASAHELRSGSMVMNGVEG